MLLHCVLFYVHNNKIRLQTLVVLVVEMYTKIMSDCELWEIRCFPLYIYKKKKKHISKSPQKGLN